MRSLLENLKEDERDERLKSVKCAGRFVANDIGQAIAEIERLESVIFEMATKELRRGLEEQESRDMAYHTGY